MPGASRLVVVARLSAIVAAASLASMLGLCAFRAIAPLEALAAEGGQIGNYLQTVGSVYAVLLAFVVSTVWNQFDAARAHIDREAAAVVDLHRTVSGLPVATRTEIQRALRGYVEAVLTDEWPAMVRRDEAMIAKVGERLDHVWVAIHRCRPSTECQHTVYAEVLTQYNDLSDVRTSRLTSSRQRIPLAMKVLLYAGAMIMVGSTYMLVFERFWVHALVTGAMAGAIAHVLYLIIDLDDPFAPRWAATQAPFERARAAFDRETHLVDADAA